MNRKNAIEILILGLWLIIALILFVYYNKSNKFIPPLPDAFNVPSISDSSKGKKFDLKRVIVLRGDTFDLTLNDKDDTRILGKLAVVATDEAKKKVYDLLNHSTNPKVLLYEKQSDGRWIVDLTIQNQKEEINLLKWLNSNNLVYK
jgi:hypothetical protein